MIAKLKLTSISHRTSIAAGIHDCTSTSCGTSDTEVQSAIPVRRLAKVLSSLILFLVAGVHEASVQAPLSNCQCIPAPRPIGHTRNPSSDQPRTIGAPMQSTVRSISGYSLQWSVREAHNSILACDYPGRTPRPWIISIVFAGDIFCLKTWAEIPCCVYAIR